MSAHKHIDLICILLTVAALLLTVAFMNGEALGIRTAERSMGYEETLFDTSRVHTIDIVIDDWDAFLETATSEEYALCSVVIDNESVKNVAIRGKGNTSLSSVKSMDSERYSFKLEFDHYQSGKSYHGLDKLSLNNIIQDNTYMKDYLTYRMMAEFGVDTPLCSFVYITVNGEDWGLYLAVEGVEDSFLQRNYGRDTGDLYKPDSMSFGGGGPGNGQNFNMDDFFMQGESEVADASGSDGGTGFSFPGGGDSSSFPSTPGGESGSGETGTGESEPVESGSGETGTGESGTGESGTGESEPVESGSGEGGEGGSGGEPAPSGGDAEGSQGGDAGDPGTPAEDSGSASDGGAGEGTDTEA